MPRIVIGPGAVAVSAVPLSVAAPLTSSNVTGKPELAVAPSVALCPTVTDGGAEIVTVCATGAGGLVGGAFAGAIVIVTDCVPGSGTWVLVASSVTLNVPAVVGTPEITPVEAFTVSPGGSPRAP